MKKVALIFDFRFQKSFNPLEKNFVLFTYRKLTYTLFEPESLYLVKFTLIIISDFAV
jgi:hypothetical protein